MISVEGNVLAGTIFQSFEKYRRNRICKDYGIRLLLLGAMTALPITEGK